jgi:hypothetical protein
MPPQGDQVAEVVGVLEVHAAARQDRLEPLLDRLLSVEADDAIGDLRVGGELADGGGILPSLASENRRRLGGLKRR